MRSLLWPVLFLFVWSPVFGAEPTKLDLERAIRLALERNLELQAKKEELGIAEGEVIRANLFLQHNPELEGDILNRRLKKPEEGVKKNLPGGGISLSQEFEIGGQPRYRRQAAQRNLERAKFEIKDIERILRFRVTDIFLRILNTQAKIKQAEQIVDLRSRLYEASRTRLASGDIPEVQLIIAEFELNGAKSDLIEFQREYEDLLSRLRIELALKEGERVGIVGDLRPPRLSLSVDELLRTAVEKRPDLAALEREREVREAEVLLTRAERIPNIVIGAFYEKDEKDNIVGMGVSIPIPVFDRRQAELRQALSRRSIANINYRNLRQAIEKGVRSAYERFKLSERSFSLYPEGMVKRFDENLELNQKAYQEGQISLPEVILFQNQVIDARLQFLDIMMNYNLSLAELKFQAAIE
ncbi:MAG: TolC family protein [Deltaproteobacteria bacterium]|nr:TolC family protein [Deltaproteobacteria bacterium]